MKIRLDHDVDKSPSGGRFYTFFISLFWHIIVAFDWMGKIMLRKVVFYHYIANYFMVYCELVYAIL